MIVASNITLNLGGKGIFDDVSFRINADQKIGVVGINGSGKSTLLKVLAGFQGLDSGTIVREKRKKIGYMPQEVVIMSDKTVLEEAFLVFEDKVMLLKELEDLESSFQQDAHQEIKSEKIERYAYLQEKLAEANIEKFEAETKRILSGLGFTQEQFAKPVSELSVGWRMRLVLVKILLQKPDFFLFDEPTNHLDMVAKDWFLQFLKDSSAGYLLVTHDRFFLEHAVEKILEIDRGRMRMYKGNYIHFEKQKEEYESALIVAFDRQQREIKTKMKTIERFRAKSSKAKMAQSMLRSLEKIEKIELSPKHKEVSFNFGHIERTGKVVLKVNDLEKSFNDKHVFSHVNFEITKGDKVALVAPNGAGKTTLLNLIIGKLSYNPENIVFGHKVSWSVFEQDQDKLLDKNAEIIDEVEYACSTSQARSNVRTMLGTFLFPGDDVYKKIGILSGGEKNRVAMVKVLLQDANFLILDEPTNHLDIQSKDILLSALKQYPGTILFVSHDRQFLDELATKIFELHADGVRIYKGNYESYLYQKQEYEKQFATQRHQQDEAKEQRVEKSSELSGKEIFEIKKKIRNCESRIDRLELDLSQLQEKFFQVDYGSDEFQSLTDQVEQTKSELSEAYTEWESMQKKLDGK